MMAMISSAGAFIRSNVDVDLEQESVQVSEKRTDF
jgi:hypothetical protein